MNDAIFNFDHIHIISQEPKISAKWYEESFGANIVREYDLRRVLQIDVQLGGMTTIIRGKRPGEKPNSTFQTIFKPQ